MSLTSIQTNRLGASNSRGERIKATSMVTWDNEPRLSVTIPYDYGQTAEKNHRNAAIKLLPKVVSEHVIYEITLITGSCDRGYVFIPVLKEVQ